MALNRKSALLPYILQWLDTMTPGEFEAQVKGNVRLVSLAQPHKKTMKIAKSFMRIDIDGATLLQTLLEERPRYGAICFDNRSWYDRNIRELEQFIASL